MAGALAWVGLLVMRRVELTAWHHHPGHPDVVVPRRVDPTGRHGPTPDMVRGRRWRRLGGGWFVPADVDGTQTEQRIVEAAVHLGAYGGVTGWAALRWSGARWFDGQWTSGELRAVPLAIGPTNLRATPSLAPSKERLAPQTLTVVDGLRVTTSVRAALFEMRYAANVRAAVKVADLALASDLVSIDELTAYATDHLNGWTGVPQAREALPLAVENCWSPTENDMRMIWTIDLGLPPPLCNRPVFDLDGKHLFTPDLLDPALGIGGEYDGGEFHPGARRARDLDRDALMRRVGIEPVTMVASDRHDPTAYIRRLRDARERAAERGAGPRRWTIDPPPWWRPTCTVAQRRALSDNDRARLLPDRRAA